MEHYHNFMGIDIGKSTFVVSLYGEKSTLEYENSPLGIKDFIKTYRDQLPNSLSIVETTGGYEFALIYTMAEQGYSVHRADTRKVKHFIRSFGNDAKTDALDAKALAHYGKERFESLEIFKVSSQEEITLFQWVQRRSELKQMLVAEKNRFKSPSTKVVSHSIKRLINLLEEEVEEITKKIKELIEGNQDLLAKQKILKTIPGIGDIIAFELLVLLPELGNLSRRKIASLAGVAPKSKDSGQFKGYRRTGSGRTGIKPILFLAAMAARNSKSPLKDFYEKLIVRGKKKMVALTALMRKILVIANAKLKKFATS